MGSCPVNNYVLFAGALDDNYDAVDLVEGYNSSLSKLTVSRIVTSPR